MTNYLEADAQEKTSLGAFDKFVHHQGAIDSRRPDSASEFCLLLEISGGNVEDWHKCAGAAGSRGISHIAEGNRPGLTT
ncbi:hypothetical protein T265_11559 [Opisthorchis viverrini]|uniref:Uncharacterized protein n=1 Tax=Opisthorchis viverrini TaxID=6198 RepID=A0A074ZX51_OPIVI|nr:hypothetical protein T265_11559 [Opisthorchis viverrini]KER19749.1 hypothetical protein T265_11559 [Opisthorchis viverrini]